MHTIPVKCPRCESSQISKNGVNANGKQRYICSNKECQGKSFIVEYTYKGAEYGMDKKIINMTANASGIRDIARVLEISKQKVQDTLKKRRNS